MKKAFWQDIVANDYTLPEGHNPIDLTTELLDYLRSSDPELRDTFAYSILARWIIRDTLYDRDQLMEMIGVLLPNLQVGLHERDTDTVFLRSYSALMLSQIMYRDTQSPILTVDDLHELIEQALQYLAEEQDLRGYVDGKGWANALSHTADWLRFMARNPTIDAAALLRMLDGIADKLLGCNDVVFSHEEPERLAWTVVEIVKRGQLSVYSLGDWLRRFVDWKTVHIDRMDYTPSNHVVYVNTRNFLFALYCRVDLAAQTGYSMPNFRVELFKSVWVYSL